MPQIQGLSATQLNELAAFDTPTICNVIELWNIRPRNTGYMDGSIRACFPHMKPMVGYALTSTFRSMAPPRSGDVYAGIAQQVEAFADIPGPPVIVYQDLDLPVASATFGEVMCSVYQAFGSTGLITSGAGRDLDQVEALGYPTFTNGTICSHGYCHTISINVPVTVGGTAVYAGDLLHGDRNGVTTIPHEIASEIPEACRELMAAEQVILDYLKNENRTAKGLNEARQQCTAMVQKLGEQLRGRR